MPVKPRITLKPGKSYTYVGTEGTYSVIAGEILEGDAVSPGSVPILTNGTSAPDSGSGKSGDIHIDRTSFKLYTRSDSGWDSGAAFRGADGSNGSNGINGNNGNNGTDGVSPLHGLLTNEVHTVPSTSTGKLKASLSDAGGNFSVYRGTSLLSTGVTYAMSSATSSDATYSWKTVGGTGDAGVKVSVNKTTGAYTVAETATNAWTAEAATVDIVATHTSSGATLTKTYKISKSMGATTVMIKASGLTFRLDAAGNPVNASAYRTFKAELSGHASSGAIEWKLYGIGSDGTVTEITTVGAVGSPTGTMLSKPSTLTVDGASYTNTNAVYATMSGTQFKAALGSYDSIKIRATYDSMYDEITVMPVSKGDAGSDALAGLLTNESHTVPSTATGKVKSGLTTAGGTFKVMLGASALSTGVTYAMSSESSSDATNSWKIVGGASGTSGLKVSVNKTTGVYAVTETLTNAWTAETATVDLVATHTASSTTITKSYTITKSMGSTTVSIKASGQTFRMNSAGSPVNGSAYRTFKAELSGHATSGAVVWRVYGVSSTGSTTDLTSVTTVATVGTMLSTPSTLTVDGASFTNTDKIYATMSGNQFNTALDSGSYDSIRVRATFDSLYDEVTIVPVLDGAAGSDGAGLKKYSAEMITRATITSTAPTVIVMNRLIESVGSVISGNTNKDGFTLSTAGRYKIDFVPSLTITNNNTFDISVAVTGRINLVGAFSGSSKVLASVSTTCNVPASGSMDASIDGLTITKAFQAGSEIKFAVLKTAGSRTTGTITEMVRALSSTEIANIVITVVADIPTDEDYGDDTFMSIQKL